MRSSSRGRPDDRTPRFCERHSNMGRGVSLCPFPRSGGLACHQCGGIVPPRRGSPTYPLALHFYFKPDPKKPASQLRTGELIATFCSSTCDEAWDATHPGFWTR